MKKTFTMLLPACCLLNAALNIPQPVLDAFEPHSFQATHDYSLNYRLLSPLTVEQTAKYPLVIFLHGAGERGQDNAAQLYHVMPKFAALETRKAFPCYVVAPQCPAEQQWVNTPWSRLKHDMPETPSQSMDATIKLIDDLIQHYPIDTARLYVIGLSMGGYGTWDLIMRYPKRFAAAVPICGGADIDLADRIKDMPIWFFHGDSDPAVPTFRARSMNIALRALGVTPKYTEFTRCGHDAWTPAMNTPELLPWLFAQHLTK